ncbi:MAG: hypothetical protein QF464_03770, partial [Myxococcota bacterium]|nr:hypothetical protein [Myxococcota bacterium]
MSRTQHLIETVEILQQLEAVAQELITSQATSDFVKIKELCEQNLELRPKLAEVRDRLTGFEPQTDEEREVIKLTAPLLKKIRDGDRVFTVW